MNRIAYLVNRLKKPSAMVRKDACEKLSWETKLPGEAIITLKQAEKDPDAHVAEAAGHTLSVHAQNNMTSPSPEQPMSHLPSLDCPWSWIGNVHPAHLLFLAMGLFMIFLSDDWRVSLLILLFLAGGILITGLNGKPGHQKIIEAWSGLAQQTGLRMDPGHWYVFGEAIPPSVSGIYRGRRISIQKQVQQISGYDGAIPVVYTCLELEVKNSGNYRFSLSPKSFGERLFRNRTAGSGDPAFDIHFCFSGEPDEFRQQACALIIRHPMLLNRPDGVIMLTDDVPAWVNWRRSTIKLNGNDLVCLQCGISTQVSGQVEIINMLCDMAELTEEMGRTQSN